MGIRWFSEQTAPTVQCDLCPKVCVMRPGERGDCRIRVNLDGALLATTYGLPAAVHVDPIEKKPLYHFRPGKPILSLATAGCNLHCRNCQNWNLSQTNPEDLDNVALPPDAVVALAQRRRIPLIAFTYSEPLAFYEYTLEGSEAARAAGIDTVLVTAGYANPGPLRRLYQVTSAANIDLKAFSDRFYQEVCGATLQPVLDAMVLAKEAGVWLEVTHLVIPTLNDEPRLFAEMCRWLLANLGSDTPLHLSRFTPRYQLENLPPTPERTLTRMAAEARDAGLNHVYVGNVLGSADQHTVCPSCELRLLERRGYVIGPNPLQESGGQCPRCRTPIAGVWL